MIDASEGIIVFQLLNRLQDRGVAKAVIEVLPPVMSGSLLLIEEVIRPCGEIVGKVQVRPNKVMNFLVVKPSGYVSVPFQRGWVKVKYVPPIQDCSVKVVVFAARKRFIKNAHLLVVV